MDLSKSDGRFLALQREFLDPTTVPPGTFPTVTGEMDGSITLPLDETEYSYPLVRINDLRVWTDSEQEAPLVRPCMGPGPYWGPYWSPFWGAWPYCW
ncbi:MAG: Slp family lipoprotein [Nitrospira sp.]|nr:Slp family lipoprotein [Nitrospira sp.]